MKDTYRDGGHLNEDGTPKRALPKLAAIKLARRSPERDRVRAYRCHCGHWHTGHVPTAPKVTRLGGRPLPQRLRQLGIAYVFDDSRSMETNHNPTPDPGDPTTIESSDIAPPRHEVDETCAGTPLDAWRRGDPYEGVMTAVRFVAAHPDVPCIAYCHDPIREVFEHTDRRQKSAGKAWAAREFPHLSIVLRQATLPYRGIGNDVVVMYADIQKPRKPKA